MEEFSEETIQESDNWKDDNTEHRVGFFTWIYSKLTSSSSQSNKQSTIVKTTTNPEDKGETVEFDEGGRPVKSYSVKEISKIQIGKVIIKECGNEGTEDSVRKANMRRLLQGVIDKFNVNQTIRTNAELQIDSAFGETVKIIAGQGEYRYIVEADEKGEIEVINVSKPSVLSRVWSYCSWG